MNSSSSTVNRRRINRRVWRFVTLSLPHHSFDEQDYQTHSRDLIPDSDCDQQQNASDWYDVFHCVSINPRRSVTGKQHISERARREAALSLKKHESPFAANRF